MSQTENDKQPSKTEEENNRIALENLIRDSVRKEVVAHQLRKSTTDTYVQRLSDTDAKVNEFIQQTIIETTRAHRISTNFFIGSYVAAFLILLSGIILVFLNRSEPRSFAIAVAFIAGSVLWFISLQNRNPVGSNRYLVNHLAKLNVIFAGYIRQIHQVDAVFEGLIGSDKDFTPQIAEQLLNNLQDAMAEAMSAISQVSGSMDD